MLTHLPAIELDDQSSELFARVWHETMTKRFADHSAGATTEYSLRGGIHLRYRQMAIKLDDRVHGAADQAAELLLPLAHLGFGA